MKNTEIVKRIRREVKNLGWTQKEFAKKSGISPTSVSRYFNLEREIPLSMLEKIADTLEVSSIYLMGVTNEVNSVPELQLTPVYSTNIEDFTKLYNEENIIEYIYISSSTVSDPHNIVGLAISGDLKEEFYSDDIALIHKHQAVKAGDLYAYIQDGRLNIERVNETMKDIILFPYGNQQVYDKGERYTIGKVVGGYKKY